MLTKTLIAQSVVLTAVLFPATLSGQRNSRPPSVSPAREFPVTMRQSVVAGKTSVGTKVEARLAIATLVDGAVVPEDAVFTGEVVESAAKTASAPSRLAIRMDSVRWKKGTKPVKVYLTAWYYPRRIPTGNDTNNEDLVPPLIGSRPSARMNRDATVPTSQASPERTENGPRMIPDFPSSGVSDHRVLMKDVESLRNSEGVTIITSRRFNIKLDSFTTYVLTGGELPATK